MDKGAVVSVTNHERVIYAIIRQLDPRGAAVQDLRTGRVKTYPTTCSAIANLMRLGYVKELTPSKVKRLGLNI